MKWAYLLLFSRCLFSVLCSLGQVSSNRWISFLWLFKITMSGFFCSYRYLKRHGASSRGQVPRQITLDCELWIHIVQNVAYQSIVSISISSLVQDDRAAIQDMLVVSLLLNKYYQTFILANCHTVRFPYNHTAIEPYSHAVILPYCHTATLPHCDVGLIWVYKKGCIPYIPSCILKLGQIV